MKTLAIHHAKTWHASLLYLPPPASSMDGLEAVAVAVERRQWALVEAGSVVARWARAARPAVAVSYCAWRLMQARRPGMAQAGVASWPLLPEASSHTSRS